MTEFDLIKRYFQTQTHNRQDVPLGIGDDAALLQPPSGQLLAVTTDALIENVHFLPNTSPKTLGHKALAISLSDLAAMGAEPAWVMLSLTLPAVDESWLSAFCQGFFDLCEQYKVQLVGGNTTRGPLAISTHLTGFVPAGKTLLRSGAKPGDLIYVTGYLGDAALALACLKEEVSLSFFAEYFVHVKARLETPTPRVSTGLALRDIATAAIDISDGLIADLGHILAQSQVGANVDMRDLPLSPTLQMLDRGAALRLATGGDDYELCFTVNPVEINRLESIFSALDVGYQQIGVIEEEAGIRLIGAEGLDVALGGYDHFL